MIRSEIMPRVAGCSCPHCADENLPASLLARVIIAGASEPCAVCHGENLGTVQVPDGRVLPRVCGACTPLPDNIRT